MLTVVLCADEVEVLFESCGLNVDKLSYERRVCHNRRTGDSWNRTWVNVRFI